VLRRPLRGPRRRRGAGARGTRGRRRRARRPLRARPPQRQRVRGRKRRTLAPARSGTKSFPGDHMNRETLLAPFSPDSPERAYYQVLCDLFESLTPPLEPDAVTGIAVMRVLESSAIVLTD